MHGLILAGGEGSRLARDGYRDPKPTVEVGGSPLLIRQIRMLEDVGCTSITCAVRADVMPRLAELDAAALAPARFLPVTTPSSLHTLALGLASLPEGPVCCTMVDTVMSGTDWRTFVVAADQELAAGADAVVVITSFVDDDNPVYVAHDRDGTVRRFGGVPGIPVVVTGGVYLFAPSARRHAAVAVDGGTSRMRGFLQSLVDAGLTVRTVPVEWVIDVDRRRDVELAERWISGPIGLAKG